MTDKDKTDEQDIDYLISSCEVKVLGEDFLEYSFRYDTKGRLANTIITISDSYYPEPLEMSCTYKYSDNLVTETVTGGDAYGHTDNDYVAKYRLNEDGTIHSCLREGHIEAGIYNIGTNETYEYENGYLKRRIARCDDEEFTGEYEWKDGDIQKIVLKEDSEEDIIIEFEYSDHLNKSNLDLSKLYYYTGYYIGGHYTADKAAFKGQSSKRLPKSMTIFAETEDESKISFIYAFDSSGRVEDVIMDLDETQYMRAALHYN